MSEVTETTTWVTARLGAGGGVRTDVTVRDFAFVADEPRDVGGMDSGATPYEYLLGALGACTAMTLRMYAKRKGWALLGHSAGGVISCLYCLDHQDELSGLICESFAFQVPAPDFAIAAL